MNNTNECVDAGDVKPSLQKWRVTYSHKHKTLLAGDIVIRTEAPQSLENYLLRLSDYTLHELCGECGQYVHIEKVDT